MAGVTGIGGIFYKVADPAATRGWYKRHLGVPAEDHGWVFGWHAKEGGAEGHTVWSPFENKTDYFAPSEREFMVNLIVDDLDAVLARLKADGIEPVGEPLDEAYGKFAWVIDPDGVKLELYQPKASPNLSG